jgi:hypothetical protein
MNGKEAKPYAISIGSLESSANPRPKYIATIMQKIPNIAYPLVVTGINTIIQSRLEATLE